MKWNVTFLQVRVLIAAAVLACTVSITGKFVAHMDNEHYGWPKYNLLIDPLHCQCEQLTPSFPALYVEALLIYFFFLIKVFLISKLFRAQACPWYHCKNNTKEF